MATRTGGDSLLETETGDEGCRHGAVLGTSWHGLLEGDDVRRGLLGWAAAAAGRRWLAGATPFAVVRERRLEAIGDLVADHVDTDALAALIDGGPPPGLPVLETRSVEWAAP